MNRFILLVVAVLALAGLCPAQEEASEGAQRVPAARRDTRWPTLEELQEARRAIDPNAPPAEEPAPWLGYWRPGMSLEEVRELRALLGKATPEPAVTQAQRKIYSDPVPAEHYAELVEAYARAGETRKAIETCKVGLELHPYVMTLRVRLAELYEQVGEVDLAVREYRMLVTDFPGWVQGRIQYALLLEKLDRRVEANEQWRAVKERSNKTAILQAAERHIEQNG